MAVKGFGQRLTMATQAGEKYVGSGGREPAPFHGGESRDIRALSLDVTVSLPPA